MLPALLDDTSRTKHAPGENPANRPLLVAFLDDISHKKSPRCPNTVIYLALTGVAPILNVIPGVTLDNQSNRPAQVVVANLAYTCLLGVTRVRINVRIQEHRWSYLGILKTPDECTYPNELNSLDI